MTPMTGFVGVTTREIARERSYSSSFSRSSAKAGIATLLSRQLTASPK
jgi:hypothetical protein